MSDEAISIGSPARLRLARSMLLARYDDGALAPSIFTVIEAIEVEISWQEHASTTDSQSVSNPAHSK